MTPERIVLAGCTGAGLENNQADKWVPRLEAAGLAASAVWSPPSAGGEERAHASALAASLGVELQTSEVPDATTAGAIACLSGDALRQFMAFAHAHSMPVLVDNPALTDTATLRAIAEESFAASVFTGLHLSAHPGFVRALRAVRDAEIGLLRAVAVDLVVSQGGGSHPDGELRTLGVYAVDILRQATGSATGRLQAHTNPAGDSWSILGQTDRDIVVSAHVSRTTSAGSTSVLRASVRMVGTHGSVMVDLTRPALSVQTAQGMSTHDFGEDSATAQLRRFTSGVRGAHRVPPVSDLVLLSEALDAIADSAKTHATAAFAW